MDHHVDVLEHPIPLAASIDAHAGFFGIDHPRATQPGEDGGDIGIQVLLATAERRVQCALPDRQAEPAVE